MFPEHNALATCVLLEITKAIEHNYPVYYNRHPFARNRKHPEYSPIQIHLPIKHLLMLSAAFSLIQSTPIIHTTPILERLLVPEHRSQSLLHANFQNRSRRLAAVTVKKAHVLVKNEIRFRHEVVGLRYKGRVMVVLSAEESVLLVRDEEFAAIPERIVGIVFASNNEHLKRLPSERLESLDVRIHVFHVVEATDDSIELEFDSILLAPRRDLVELRHLVARATTDFDVGLLVERVAGDSQDVDVRAVFLEKALLDETAVANDGDRFEAQIFLAEVYHLAEELGIEERLSTGEVNLSHPGSLE